MSKSDFQKLYEKKENLELYKIYLNIQAYSEEAIQVIQDEIIKRGGTKKLQIEYEAHILKAREIETCTEIIKHNLAIGKSKDFIRNEIVLKYIDENEFQIIYSEVEEDFNEKEINKKTTIKSLIGGILGSIIGALIGGILWGMMMIGSGRIFFIMGLGLIFLCYFFVWLFSRKDKKNKVTIMLTIIAIILALIIGQLIFEIVGPREFIN